MTWNLGFVFLVFVINLSQTCLSNNFRYGSSATSFIRIVRDLYVLFTMYLYKDDDDDDLLVKRVSERSLRFIGPNYIRMRKRRK